MIYQMRHESVDENIRQDQGTQLRKWTIRLWDAVTGKGLGMLDGSPGGARSSRARTD